MERIRVGLIGVSGFAQAHLKSIRYSQEKGYCSFEAVVIKEPLDLKNNEEEKRDSLAKEGIRIYKTYQEMFETEKGKLDAVTIPVGIDMHKEMSIAALKAGYHVLCEKPVTGKYEDALEMQRVKNESGRFLAIGYQHISTPTIQRIKEIALSKHLGNLRQAKTLVLWPRSSAYYDRNYWAGKIEVNGKTIFDSPLQNATSHYLNNMLYVAGTRKNASLEPSSVYAENYRANRIESPDTQFARIVSKEGIEITMTSVHAAPENRHPETEFIFENGKIDWSFPGTAKVYQGEMISEEFDDTDVPREAHGFLDFFTAIRENREPLCTIDNSIQQTLVVNKIFESAPVSPVPDEHIEVHDVPDSEAKLTVIKGIVKASEESYATRKGFGELELPWGVEGETLLLK
ncbi:MAG: Gfo/Idh/MocA family protein [Spirochaetia bacterium]